MGNTMGKKKSIQAQLDKWQEEADATEDGFILDVIVAKVESASPKKIAAWCGIIDNNGGGPANLTLMYTPPGAKSIDMLKLFVIEAFWAAVAETAT